MAEGLAAGGLAAGAVTTGASLTWALANGAPANGIATIEIAANARLRSRQARLKGFHDLVFAKIDVLMGEPAAAPILARKRNLV